MEKFVVVATWFTIAVLVVLTYVAFWFGMWCLYVDIGAKLWPSDVPWVYPDFRTFLLPPVLLLLCCAVYKALKPNRKACNNLKIGGQI